MSLRDFTNTAFNRHIGMQTTVAAGEAAEAERRRSGGEADTPIRVTRMRQNAPQVRPALDEAGIPFAFTAGGLQNPGDLVRNVARTVREGGLSEDLALKALTVNAAKRSGAGDRLGTIEKGRMANVIVTDGNPFDSPRIRHVFVAGWPVEVDVPALASAGRGGRGGGQ